jgi:hypothetical protein
MKKFSLTLLGLGMTAFMCQAQISVWKMSLKDATTGNGQTLKSTSTGYFIIDFDASRAAFIEVNGKHFSLYEPADADYDYGAAIGAKNASTWVFALSKTYGSLTASGKSSSLNLGVSGLNVGLPKTMAITGTLLTSEDSGVRILDQYSGALSFDLPDTKTANVLGDALTDTENRLITALQSKGFTYDGAQLDSLLKRLVDSGPKRQTRR